MRIVSLRLPLLALLCFGLVFSRPALTAVMAAAPQPSGKQKPWLPSQVVTPKQALRELRGPVASRPHLLQVGFDVLYRGGHIPGAVYAGPALRPDGLEKLRATVSNWSRGTPVLIYCGCCPFNMCPNVRPAFQLLRQMGFRKLQVLYLPHSFQRDWIEKHLPVTSPAS